jgi:ribose 5-phosphate isomerase A
MPNIVTLNDPLARAAIEGIHADMTVGLGTGRAAARAIRALATLEHAPTLTCVSTSDASTKLATTLGLTVRSLDDALARRGHIDVLFDGADQVDPSLRMIKGRGGAMTREKIVARAAKFRRYLIQDHKQVRLLGDHCELPVEVLAFAPKAVEDALKHESLIGHWRTTDDGSPAHTDDQNPILDLVWPSGWEPEPVARLLHATPGVVGHGVFLTEAHEVIVESDAGLQRLTR